LILATNGAAKAYTAAIEEAKGLHPGAKEAVFSPREPETARGALLKHQPRYALVFIRPDELDVNFAWQWLRLSAAVDDDPFVDVRTGFITGESPQAAAAFVRRIRAAVEGRLRLPAVVIDNLGPNTTAIPSMFLKMPGSFFLRVFAWRFWIYTISHGTRGLTKKHLGSMEGAGLIHFGGHGYPDGIVDGLKGLDVRRLKLAPCLVFSGACYTGVTRRWFRMDARKIPEERVDTDNCFCLGLLANNVVGYLAALHADHGIPVYQEMEYLAFTGAPLGEILKHTHDGVILACGARMPQFETLTDGVARPRWTPSDVMLKGTASRVLFGDPAMTVLDKLAPPPFEIARTSPDNETLRVKAVLKNINLKSTFTDTYHADLASNRNLFNDRARIWCDLPKGWDAIQSVRVVKVAAGSQQLRHRLVGFGLEKEGTSRRLHVQVDVPTTGYMQSPFRQRSAVVELEVRRRRE